MPGASPTPSTISAARGASRRAAGWPAPTIRPARPTSRGCGWAPGPTATGCAASARGWRSATQHTLAEIAAIQADIVSGRARGPGGAGGLVVPPDRRAAPGRGGASGWSTGTAPISREAVGASIFEAFWRVWLERVADGRFPTRLVDLVQSQCGALARAILLGQQTDWFSSRTVREQVRAAGREALRRLEADGWRRHGRLALGAAAPGPLAARAGRAAGAAPAERRPVRDERRRQHRPRRPPTATGRPSA